MIWIKVPDEGMVRKAAMAQIEIGFIGEFKVKLGSSVSPQLKYYHGNKPVDPRMEAYVMEDQFKRVRPSARLISRRHEVIRTLKIK